jgi:hypothetical protein
MGQIRNAFSAVGADVCGIMFQAVYVLNTPDRQNFLFWLDILFAEL